MRHEKSLVFKVIFQNCTKHLETFLKTKCLKDWIHMTKSNQIMRRIKAEEFEKQKLISNSFGKWVEVCT